MLNLDIGPDVIEAIRLGDADKASKFLVADMKDFKRK